MRPVLRITILLAAGSNGTRRKKCRDTANTSRHDTPLKWKRHLHDAHDAWLTTFSHRVSDCPESFPSLDCLPYDPNALRHGRWQNPMKTTPFPILPSAIQDCFFTGRSFRIRGPAEMGMPPGVGNVLLYEVVEAWVKAHSMSGKERMTSRRCFESCLSAADAMDSEW